MDDYELVKPEKAPREYGKRLYVVELFIIERVAVTVYADSEDQALKTAMEAPYRNERGMMTFPEKNGIANVQFDEDFDFEVEHGDVVDDTEEDG